MAEFKTQAPGKSGENARGPGKDPRSKVLEKVQGPGKSGENARGAKGEVRNAA